MAPIPPTLPQITCFFTLLLCFLAVVPSASASRRLSSSGGGVGPRPLRFGNNGEFKIVQVADMHYADGKSSGCLNVLPNQFATCSDLNTTAFIQRMIRVEKPDLIVFTGDNIFGADATDAAKSMDMAFRPAVEAGIPWAAVLGNHDQESNLGRQGLMAHIAQMPHALSRVNPAGLPYAIDGFGNYNLEVAGAAGSALANKSALNLFFLDSGDYSTVPAIPSSYGWIKPSQQLWFQQTSNQLQRAYRTAPAAQDSAAPSLVYFHIPLPEYADVSNMTGVLMEQGISSASVNSGFFTAMVESGDVRAVFVGHDHLNDFCGNLTNINLCYSGGFGYHAYGKAGWSRRSRVVSVLLEKDAAGSWGGVESIKTWKRLDDERFSVIDSQVLCNKSKDLLHLV